MADLVGYNGERKEFKYVGAPKFFPGKLSYNLATGKAKYGADATAPDMLFAKFLRSPYGHAAVKSVDVSAARALPGVVDILTWQDENIKKLATSGYGGPPTPFLSNVAYQEDAEVAVIGVAESEDVCDEAIKKLKIDWDVLAHIVDPRDGLKPDAPIIRTNPKGGKPNVEVASKMDGNIEEGFKQADHIIEFDFQFPAKSSQLETGN